jgi:hypothetical protein
MRGGMTPRAALRERNSCRYCRMSFRSPAANIEDRDRAARLPIILLEL